MRPRTGEAHLSQGREADVLKSKCVMLPDLKPHSDDGR